MFGNLSVDFQSKWPELSDVVSKLIRHEYLARDRWNNSFHDVYILCTSRPSSHAATLYSSTTKLISSRVEEIAMDLSQVDDSELLPAYEKHWNVFHLGLMDVHNLYRVVNQQYVKNLRPTEAEMCYGAIVPMAERHTMVILEVGLAHWKLYLIDTIKQRLSDCLMREVANDREGISGQQSSIAPCLQSFHCVGELRDIEKAGADIYNEIFHNPLLSQTEKFYSHWAAQCQAETSCSEYINRALILRQQEGDRADRYYASSKESVFNLFQQIVVKDRLDFLNQSIQQMIAEERKSDLHNLYLLLVPNDLYFELSQCFGQHIAACTREALSTLSNEPVAASKDFVESLLSLRDRFTRFLDEVFDGNTSFRNQMDKAFNLAINNRTICSRKSSSSNTESTMPRPSELLSRYMDSLLRKSVNSMSQPEIETKLKSLITIFKYLDDKDMFQRFYQKMLFKRLISNIPPVMDLEELVISQLKAVCGYEFTSKFQRMFSDIQLAPELNHGFNEHLKRLKIRFKFSHQFNILTQCSWPISSTNSTEFNLPPELQECNAYFEEFYASSYQGRKMRWVHQFSTVELALLYLDKPYQIHAPATHAAILLHFDAIDSDRILLRDLYNQIAITQPTSGLNNQVVFPDGTSTTVDTSIAETTQTQLVHDLILQILTPLLELGILCLNPDDMNDNTSPTTQPSPNSWVILNPDFKNKRLRIRVTTTSQNKETIQTEAHKVEQQVTDDRRCFIKAAIVRIMKSHRQMDHTALLAEVVKQASSRFHAETALIKQCIDNLIEQDYLERNPENQSQYHYLA